MSKNRDIPTVDLVLPSELRERLKEAIGPVFAGELPSKYLERSPIITVGDVVTDALYAQGIEPDVMIVDGKTRRGEYDLGDIDGVQERNLTNPPKKITKEAWGLIDKAIEEDDPVLIKVRGEEDLLSLVCIAMCPIDGIVIYGIPGEGMVINEIDENIKNKTWQVINKMKKVEEGEKR